MLWLALLIKPQLGRAQQLSWEKQLSYTSPTDVFGYLHQITGGDYLVSGIGSLGTTAGYPFIYARVQLGSALVYQRIGRKLATLEHGVVLLSGPNASSLLAASISVRAAGNYITSRLFFQRIRPNGDTLPGLSYPLSFLEGYPTRAVREGDSVRVLTYAVDNQNVGQYALLSTDTVGAIGQVRRYPNPVFGNAYPGDLVRTARGGWLIVGEFAVAPYTHPYLVETDAQGRLRRQRDPLLFAGSTEERVRRSFNNLIRLRDGSGYVFSGWQKTSGQTYGFLCKLDTALNVTWTYRHPPQATAALNPIQVYELADGTLVWLTNDSSSSTQIAPAIYVVRVSATGQLISQHAVSSSLCGRLGLYAWQPLAGGGALAVGTAASCTATPGTSPAYVARIDQATLLAATAPAASASPDTQVYPNPAGEAATWQGSVPLGAHAAQLHVLDLLGRVVRTVPVSGRGAHVTQPLDLAGLAPGAYTCRLLADGQAAGAPARLLVSAP